MIRISLAVSFLPTRYALLSFLSFFPKNDTSSKCFYSSSSGIKVGSKSKLRLPLKPPRKPSGRKGVHALGTAQSRTFLREIGNTSCTTYALFNMARLGRL
ncbi:hypothetical protein F5B19DRAFT_437587 [Rostrohypoxylon terebratum]|nr:hypothetical protein F5B19DRAFT_437587 [Rostrohypoxylon terebratum]